MLLCPNGVYQALLAKKRQMEYNQSMKSYLIKDTTREERERIVSESVGQIEAACDGCAPGVIEMYQAYIDGEKELREINREYVAHYISGREGPTRSECGMF